MHINWHFQTKKFGIIEIHKCKLYIYYKQAGQEYSFMAETSPKWAQIKWKIQDLKKGGTRSFGACPLEELSAKFRGTLKYLAKKGGHIKIKLLTTS